MITMTTFRNLHPLLRILCFAVVFAGIGLTGLGVAHLVDPTGPSDGPGMIITALGLIVAAVAAYLFLVVVLEDRRPTELALRRWPGLLGGLLLGGALVLGSAAIVWALGGLAVDGIRPAGDIPWLTDIVMTGLFAGVVEEILFRGVAFRYLEEWLGSWPAVLASAVIFGSVHIFAAGATWLSTAATIVEAGLLFAMVYLLTRSLWWVIGVHSAWNFVLSIILGLPVSGNVNEGLLIVRPTGPEYLHGGAYGLESSVVAFVLLSVVAFVGLWWAHRSGCMRERSVRTR